MDLTQIQEAIGLASAAAGMTGKAATTAETIKGLFSGGKEPGTEELQALVNSLAQQLTSANMTNVQVSDALRKLSAELAKEEAFEREKARYELMQTPEGSNIYQLRSENAEGQPTHFVCPVCLNRDRIISFVDYSGGSQAFCQTDRKHMFRFGPKPQATRLF